MAAVFAAYPHVGPVLPAMGYSPAQIESLASSIRSAGAELVIAGTPVDLARLLDNEFPVVRARYDFADLDEPDGLWAEVERLIAAKGLE